MPTAYDLRPLVDPTSIAVIGASDRQDSVGGRVLANLLAGSFDGPVHPVNPKRSEVQGRPCFPRIGDVDGHVDLAVIATPAATVQSVLRECGEHGVRGAVVMSAGFAEAGETGKRLMADVVQEARSWGIRMLGPNCVGLLNPHRGINATFGKGDARPGSLALVSQSGALCTAILDWAAERNVGFSSVISLGESADIGFGDALDYLAMDSHTRSILLYVEGVRHARRFVSGLRAAARLKPVVVVKAGRHEAGSRAAVSHTGAIVGSDDIFDAVIRRAGAVRATTVEQLFAAAELLATSPRVGGNRLAIVTNAGGPGVLATDRAVDLGVSMAKLSEETVAKLDESLPANWSGGNPVDILGDAPPNRYEQAVATCLADDGVDGVLAMLTPQAMTEPLEAARHVIAATKTSRKPVLSCWMGGVQVAEGRRLLSSASIPSFPSPETSVEAFGHLATYFANQRLLLQVPPPLADRTEPDVEGARLIVESVLAEGRTVLGTTESKAVLAAFRIPVVPAIEVSTANEALVAAESVGLPVAMKIASPDITHKSDVGGVRLNVASPRDVRRVFTELVAEAHEQLPDAHIRGVTIERMARRPHGRELNVGVVHDPVFGPAISVGAGGTIVDLLRDRSVALPPLNDFIAREMIGRTRVAQLLGAFRGMPEANLDALVQVLLRVSTLVCELPHVRELDMNPLVVDEHGAIALDCRVVVGHPGTELGPYSHMAIHPYPTGLERTLQLSDGTDIVLRPIRPEDAKIEHVFVASLSERSRYFRFMHSLKELTPEMLVRFTQPDYDREMAFIAVVDGDEGEIQVGVARYTTNPDRRSCEFALVVADEWQGKGIGSQLMRRLMETGRMRGLEEIIGEVLTENRPMLSLMRRLGFRIRSCPDDATLQIVARPL